MSQKSICFKTENSLINAIKNRENIQIVKKQSAMAKIFMKKKYADIYFHSGSLDEESIQNIINSKITITNSFSSMSSILDKTKIDNKRLKVIYPSVNIDFKDVNELKIRYFEKYSLSKNTKLILFTAKNFKTSGIKEFLDISSNLTFNDFKLIIAGTKQQLAALDFTLTKYQKLEQKIIKVDEVNTNIDDLYLISDVFLLPTHNKNIASSIIKAMFCECVVFTTMNNDAKEIIDIFATMEYPSDPSTAFKIDAILYDENELKNIKSQNRKIALEMSLEKNIQKFDDILLNI